MTRLSPAPASSAMDSGPRPDPAPGPKASLEVPGRSMIDRRKALGWSAAAMFARTPNVARPPPHRRQVGDPMPGIDLLRLGLTTRLRSRQGGDQHVPVDIRRRDIRIEWLDEVERLVLLQRWDSAVHPGCASGQRSVVERGSLRPLSRRRVAVGESGRRTGAFRFSAPGRTGRPGRRRYRAFGLHPELRRTDVQHRGRSGAPGPALAGGSLHIHPRPPARRRAAGALSLVGRRRGVPEGPDGRFIDCRRVETDHNVAGNPPARFGLTRTNQQVLKAEARGPDGTLHRKTVLMPSAHGDDRRIQHRP